MIVVHTVVFVDFLAFCSIAFIVFLFPAFFVFGLYLVLNLH